jgi:hypothetical protein
MRLNLFAPKKRFDAFEIAPKPTLFDGKANTAALEFGQNTVWRLCALFS